MKQDIDEIIKKLEQVQDLLFNGRIDEAKTVAYECQCLAIFFRDHKAGEL